MPPDGAMPEGAASFRAEAAPAPGTRVVHVVRQFAPSVGGLEEAVANLARLQRERFGLDSRVLTLDRLFLDPRNRLPSRETIRGVPVERLPWRGSRRYPLAPGALAAVRSADLAHVHGIDFFFDYLAATRPFHRRKLVGSTHGGFFHTDFASGLKRRWFNTITRRSVRAYDAVIACSHSDAAMFRALDVPSLTTIENGVDLGKFARGKAMAPREPRRLLAWGRFASHKNLPALFPLLRALLAREAGWTLTVAGSPWDVSADELRACAASEAVADAVRVIENPADEALAAEIETATFFCSASTHEGFGIAAVEAAAAGLIPVLADIPPFRRLVARLGDGYVGPFSDADRIAAWLVEAAAAREVLRRRASAIAARAAAYDWVHATAAHASLYARVLAKAA